MANPYITFDDVGSSITVYCDGFDFHVHTDPALLNSAEAREPGTTEKFWTIKGKFRVDSIVYHTYNYSGMTVELLKQTPTYVVIKQTTLPYETLDTNLMSQIMGVEYIHTVYRDRISTLSNIICTQTPPTLDVDQINNATTYYTKNVSSDTGVSGESGVETAIGDGDYITTADYAATLSPDANYQVILLNDYTGLTTSYYNLFRSFILGWTGETLLQHDNKILSMIIMDSSLREGGSLYDSTKRLEMGEQYKDYTLAPTDGSIKKGATGKDMVGDSGFGQDLGWHMKPSVDDIIRYTVDIPRSRKVDVIHDFPYLTGPPDNPTDHLRFYDDMTDKYSHSPTVGIGTVTPYGDVIEYRSPEDLSDYFLGTTLDSSKWTLSTSGNMTAVQNDKITMSSSGGSAGSAFLTTQYLHDNGFDVSISFSDFICDATDSGVLTIEAYDSSGIGVVVKFTKGVTTNAYQMFELPGSTPQLGSDVNSTDSTGKLRITRDDNLFRGFYHDGSNYVEIGDGPVVTGDLYIRVSFTTTDSFPACSVDIDNFIAWYGATDYRLPDFDGGLEFSRDLSDDFYGKTLDMDKWDIYRVGIGQVSHDDKIHFHIPGGGTAGIVTNYQFLTDFDVEHDFTDFSPKTDEDSQALMLQAVDSTGRGVVIRYIVGDPGTPYRNYQMNTIPGWGVVATAATTDVDGKLRMVKNLDTFTTYYWDTPGESWVELGSIVWEDVGDVNIGLYLTSSLPDNPDVSVFINEYIVNNGNRWTNYPDTYFAIDGSNYSNTRGTILFDYKYLTDTFEEQWIGLLGPGTTNTRLENSLWCVTNLFYEGIAFGIVSSDGLTHSVSTELPQMLDDEFHTFALVYDTTTPFADGNYLNIYVDNQYMPPTTASTPVPFTVDFSVRDQFIGTRSTGGSQYYGDGVFNNFKILDEPILNCGAFFTGNGVFKTQQYHQDISYYLKGDEIGISIPTVGTGVIMHSGITLATGAAPDGSDALDFTSCDSTSPVQVPVYVTGGDFGTNAGTLFFRVQFKYSGTPVQTQYIAYEPNNTIYHATTGDLYACLGGLDLNAGTFSPIANRWYNFMWRYDSNGVEFFIDDVFKISVAGVPSITAWYLGKPNQTAINHQFYICDLIATTDPNTPMIPTMRNVATHIPLLGDV